MEKQRTKPILYIKEFKTYKEIHDWTLQMKNESTPIKIINNEKTDKYITIKYYNELLTDDIVSDYYTNEDYNYINYDCDYDDEYDSNAEQSGTYDDEMIDSESNIVFNEDIGNWTGSYIE